MQEGTEQNAYSSTQVLANSMLDYGLGKDPETNCCCTRSSHHRAESVSVTNKYPSHRHCCTVFLCQAPGQSPIYRHGQWKSCPVEIRLAGYTRVAEMSNLGLQATLGLLTICTRLLPDKESHCNLQATLGLQNCRIWACRLHYSC